MSTRCLSSNRLGVMLGKVLCVKGFTRDGEGLAKCGEMERNGCGEWIEWMPCRLSERV